MNCRCKDRAESGPIVCELHRVFRWHGVVVPLSPNTLRLGSVLVNNPNTLVLHDTLAVAIWGEGVLNTDYRNNLHRHLHILRNKIGDVGKQIVPAARIGYAFLNPLPQLANDGDRFTYIVDLPVL